MIREPCVSGIFYPSKKSMLKENIEKTLDNINTEDQITGQITAGVAPHAGYVYSGKTACYTYNQIRKNRIPETFIIIGPNHTGYGNSSIALSSATEWNTPLGDIKVDTELNNELQQRNPNIKYDDRAHQKEHGTEVELPFIQYITEQENKNTMIVPIVLSNQTLELSQQLARTIYESAEKLERDIIIIASTDLTHYENSENARTKDEKVMQSIENMDEQELYSNITNYQITMCGYGPAITAITYSKLANAKNARILDYSNSGDAFGDYDSVVGYTSAIITK